MKAMSIGKLRGLQQLADSSGILTVVAIDHRGSLQKALNKKNPAAVGYQDMVDFKLDLCRAVAPFASAALLDPIYGAPQAIASGVLPGHMGLLVSIEQTGYTGDSTARLTELLPNWGVKKIKKLGASAVKLLIYFRPDLKDIAARQLDLVARVADECIREDIPLLVETLSYPVEAIGENSTRFAALKPELVIETARQVTALPIDVLKAEFPADMDYEKDEPKLLDYCKKLDLASRLPWVLLSAGADYVHFKKQVELASKAGASGFMAGRALWQEAVQLPSRDARADFFKTTTASRLKEIADIADKYGRPWYAKLGPADGAFAPAAEDWYQRY
ncbi:MAG: tagatose 1,6-diphosphate aldolase [Chloroflexi bacterium]|nr:tagatose 1,6-diphosphate aldolase [Chloroflexota bacterium]